MDPIPPQAPHGSDGNEKLENDASNCVDEDRSNGFCGELDRLRPSEIEMRVRNLVDRCSGLQEAAAAHSSRVRQESQALSQRALALEAEMRQILADVNAAVEKDAIGHAIAEQLDEDLYRARSMIYEGDIVALLPHKSNGFFLRLLLGPVNVRATRNDVRFRVKEEYNTYRDRTAIIFLSFPSILLLMKNWVWNGCLPALPVQIYQAWLLFFYTSLALRENILRINGSDIRPWWVYHHYCAMFMALVSLTWEIKSVENCATNQQGVRLFLAWAVMQGVSMLLQNRYQRQRLYTRIALGKAGRMDVVWGETAGVQGQLWLLYPLLFILQAFQFFIGLQLLRTSILEYGSEWQVVVCGLLLLVMAVGNFANTMATVSAKARIKAKMGKKGKQMLQKMASSNWSITKT